MTFLNLYKNAFRCRRCQDLIGTYPCTYCGFTNIKKTRIVDGEQWVQ